MAVIITPQKEIDAYFASPALSQSAAKKLLSGIGAYLAAKKDEKTLYYEEKDSLIIGSGVDVILTGEPGEFEKQFYISDLTKKPSDVEMSIINRVFDTALQFTGEHGIGQLSVYRKLIDNAVIAEGWYGGKPGETRIATLIEKCSPYFEDLKKSIGKTVLTFEQNKLIQDIVFSLRTNPVTTELFDRQKQAKMITTDVYLQLPIYFTYRGVACKALLDMLVVVKVPTTGAILSVKPYDLKTMNGSTLGFISNLKKWGYHIQAAWYKEALVSKDTSFKTFDEAVIDNFRFIVESNTNPGQPLIYQVDKEIMTIGKYGKKDVYVQTPNHEFKTLVQKGTKGFDSLIDIYLYQEEYGWKEEEIITRNNGVLQLGWNGIMS